MSVEAERTPLPFLWLSGAVFATGIICLALSWAFFPPAFTLPLLLVIVGAALSELFAFSFPIFSVSMAYPLAMSAALLGGPTAACLVAAVSSVSPSDIRRRRPLSIILFNVGQLLLSTALGGWFYVLLGGRTLGVGAVYQPLVSSDFPAALVGMLAAAVACSAVNLVATSLGVSTYQSRDFRQVFSDAAAFVPTQIPLAFVGFLMAQVMAINAFALPLFIFPLVISQQLYQRYTGLKEAYVDTVRSLVAALEEKDPYTRGHSERVATYATAIGASMRLDSKSLERLEYAALLHDLGKLALPRELLTKQDRLNLAELALMREHPANAARMIERIPPLRELAVLVTQHHERFDGAGYPLGIGGESIHVLARVLAVADSYDAMTTDRAYRPALTHQCAVAELIAGAGSQFDPDVVRTFIAAGIGCRDLPEGLPLRGPASVFVLDEGGV